MANLSKERILGELEKALLKSKKPSIFFESLKEMDGLKVWFPEMEKLVGIPQPERHHPEGDVWNHTMLVLDAAAELREEATQPLEFMLSAMVHDLGKIVTTQVSDMGKITSYKHEIEGSSMAGEAISRISNEVKLKKYVKNMVLLHGTPNRLADSKAKAYSTNKMFDKSISPEDLILLAKADSLGRGMDVDYSSSEDFLRERLVHFCEVSKMEGVSGKDLLELGLKPSPQFSSMLERAHDLKLRGLNKRQVLSQLKVDFHF